MYQTIPIFLVWKFKLDLLESFDQDLKPIEAINCKAKKPERTDMTWVHGQEFRWKRFPKWPKKASFSPFFTLQQYYSIITHFNVPVSIWNFLKTFCCNKLDSFVLMSATTTINQVHKSCCAMQFKLYLTVVLFNQDETK